MQENKSKPCGECGKMVGQTEKHTYEDCLKQKNNEEEEIDSEDIKKFFKRFLYILDNIKWDLRNIIIVALFIFLLIIYYYYTRDIQACNIYYQAIIEKTQNMSYILQYGNI